MKPPFAYWLNGSTRVESQAEADYWFRNHDCPGDVTKGYEPSEADP